MLCSRKDSRFLSAAKAKATSKFSFPAISTLERDGRRERARRAQAGTLSRLSWLTIWTGRTPGELWADVTGQTTPTPSIRQKKPCSLFGLRWCDRGQGTSTGDCFICLWMSIPSSGTLWSGSGTHSCPRGTWSVLEMNAGTSW
jgi:hypothetical protein